MHCMAERIMSDLMQKGGTAEAPPPVCNHAPTPRCTVQLSFSCSD